MLTSAADSRASPQPVRPLPASQEQTRGREIRITDGVLNQPALDQQIATVLSQQIIQRTVHDRHRWRRHHTELAQVLKQQRHPLRRGPRH
jgi:hypothetical protein